jgi:hypothetical protein
VIGTGFGRYGRAPISWEQTVQTREDANSSCAAEADARQREAPGSVHDIASIISKDWEYLGGIRAAGNHEPSSVKRLGTDAYLLALPTGAQLRLISSAVGPDGTALPAPNDAVPTGVASLLDEYNALANEYNGSDERPRRENKEIELEKKLMAVDSALKDAIDIPGSGRSGAFQALRNGLREATTLRGLRTDWRYWEMLGVSPAEFEYAAQHADHLSAWRDKGFSAREALSFRRANYEPDDVLHLKRTGITGPLAKQLDQRGYTREFFEETLGKPASLAEAGIFLQDHHDAWAENQGREYGSGECNTVTARFFIDREQHANHAVGSTGSAKAERIFKPEKFIAASVDSNGEDTARAWDLQAGESIAGEDNDSGLLTLQTCGLTDKETLANPRIIGRNLASCRLAKAFGTDVIVESELAISLVPVTGPEKSAYQARTGRQAPDVVFMPGVMMEKAEESYRLSPNTTPTKPDAGSEAAAEFYRNMTWLQLVDQISGQIDRHWGNMRISAAGKFKGIDNDQSWPPRVRESKNFGIWFEDRRWNLTHKETGFPRIVDEEMVSGLCGFTDAERMQWKEKKLPAYAVKAARKRARETLARAVKGCITKAEMRAGQRRLHVLQDYLLGSSIKIISHWADYDATAKQ